MAGCREKCVEYLNLSILFFLYKPPCSVGHLEQAVKQSKLAKGKDGKNFFLYNFNKCVKTVFLPYKKLGWEEWRYRFLWEWACENLEAPDLYLGSGFTPVISESWLWTSSHLRPTLDGIPGWVHLSLLPGDGISESISQLFYDVPIGVLNRQSQVLGQKASGASRALPLTQRGFYKDL